MLDALARTLAQIFSRPFRSILWRSLGLTLVLLVALGALGLWAMGSLPDLGIGWLDAAVDVLLDTAVIVGLIFLIVPVTAIFIPLFQDEVAEAVEGRYYPDARGPRPSGMLEGVRLGIAALIVLLAANLVALPLALIVPGLGFVIFLVLNGFLLGREFFEAAAIRHYPPAGVKALRRRHAGRIVLAGMVVAGVLAIPIVNILVPLFGTAFMVHVLHRVQALDAGEA